MANPAALYTALAHADIEPLMSGQTIEILTLEGKPWRVNGAKFENMRKTLMTVLPLEAPGMKVSDARDALLPLLDQALFPGGAKAMWWIKAVQLDHEARGLIKRAPGSPVRLYKS